MTYEAFKQMLVENDSIKNKKAFCWGILAYKMQTSNPADWWDYQYGKEYLKVLDADTKKQVETFSQRFLVESQ